MSLIISRDIKSAQAALKKNKGEPWAGFLLAGVICEREVISVNLPSQTKLGNVT